MRRPLPTSHRTLTSTHDTMPRLGLAICAALTLAAPTLGAQSIPGAVLAAHEPHHHLAYEDSSIRVLRVHVGAHDSTLLHEHDPDYFWIALGTSSFVNARPGLPDAVVAAPALSVHYAPGHFAHVARNPGDTPFDNITIELLGAQTNVRNLCEPALAGKPTACDTTSRAIASGIEHPAFASDQLRVTLLQLAGGASVHRAHTGTRAWIVALDTSDTRGLEAPAPWRGGVSVVRGSEWKLRNRGRRSVRVLLIEAMR